MLFDMPALIDYNAGMKSKHKIQYTIRGISKQLNEVLRHKAKQEGKSLNRTIIEVIKRGLGFTKEEVHNHDMDDLIDTWVEDSEFDKAIAEMHRIDEELWK